MMPVVVTSMILLSLYHTYYNNHISDHGYDQPVVFGTSSVGASLLWKHGASCCYKQSSRTFYYIINCAKLRVFIVNCPPASPRQGWGGWPQRRHWLFARSKQKICYISQHKLITTLVKTCCLCLLQTNDYCGWV